MQENINGELDVASVDSDDFSVWERLHLDSYIDKIKKIYEEKHKIGYRWVHQPISNNDALPQVYQSNSPNAIDFKFDIDDDMDDVVLSQSFSQISLSNFDSIEQARSAYCYQLNKRLDGKPSRNKIIERFQMNKGTHIVKVEYTSENAYVGPSSENGHFDAILKKDVKFSDIVDENFIPIKIDIE